MWPISIANITRPKPRYVWTQIRLLHETDKAILVNSKPDIWIPKSQICRIRLKNGVFEVYIREDILG